MMEDETRRACWEDYMAVSLSMAGQAITSFGGGKWPIGSWLEMAYPERKPQDNRNGQQVIDDLISKL